MISRRAFVLGALAGAATPASAAWGRRRTHSSTPCPQIVPVMSCGPRASTLVDEFPIEADWDQRTNSFDLRWNSTFDGLFGLFGPASLYISPRAGDGAIGVRFRYGRWCTNQAAQGVLFCINFLALDAAGRPVGRYETPGCLGVASRQRSEYGPATTYRFGYLNQNWSVITRIRAYREVALDP